MAFRWRDPKWWVAITVTVVLGVASLFLALPHRKRLVVVEVSKTGFSVQRLPGITITAGGKTIETAYAEVLGIYNGGTDPIAKSDFDGPLSLTFGNDEVVIPYIGNTTPDNLKPEISVDQRTVKLQPLLLNPGDTICLWVIKSNSLPPTVAGHIAGVSAIEFVDEATSSREVSHRYYYLDWPIGLILTVLASIFIAAAGRILVKSNFKCVKVIIELSLAAAVCWTGGLLLLGYGAESLGLYKRFPSNVVQIGFFVILWTSMAWWFLRYRRAPPQPLV